MAKDKNRNLGKNAVFPGIYWIFFSISLIMAAILILTLSSVPLQIYAQAADIYYNTVPPSVQAHTLGTTDSIQIDDSGAVTISGAEVVQLAGNTFFARVYWGDTFLRITVRTDGKTLFTKHYGGNISVSDISVGDFLTIQGSLYTGESILDMTATNIKDWSIQTQGDQFYGTVTGMATTTTGFILTTGTPQTQIGSSALVSPQIIVSISPNTSMIKGNLTDLTMSSINIGDKILEANGIYDHGTNTLAATSVKIYQDMTLFVPKNFSGKIKSILGNTLPLEISMVVYGTSATSSQQSSEANNTTYAVYIPTNASVMAANRSSTSIARFLVGDLIRVYGTIRETDHHTIDAEIVRNLDL